MIGVPFNQIAYIYHQNIPEDISFKTINISNKYIIATSKEFYKSLGDSNI